MLVEYANKSFPNNKCKKKGKAESQKSVKRRVELTSAAVKNRRANRRLSTS